MSFNHNEKFGLKDVQVLSREKCHSGFLSIDRLHIKHRLYQGGWSIELDREVMRKEPGVGVLLYDPDLDMVLLVEQFRVGCLDNQYGPWVIELVAGIVDTDESASEVALRECQEEADVVVTNLVPICEYYNSPGASTEKLSIFCARVDIAMLEGLNGTGAINGLKEEGEDIRSIVMSRTEAEQAVQSGQINNAMSIIAIQWLTLNLTRVKKDFENDC